VASSTSRLGLDEPSATDAISGFPAEDVQALGVLDNAALYLTGTLAARSSVTPLVAGVLYYATDSQVLAWYTGSAWVQIASVNSAFTTSGAIAAALFEGSSPGGVRFVEANGHQVTMGWTGSVLQFTVDGTPVSVA
jgi:hypothetical protein